MAELELVRVDPDDRVLVLRAPDGTEHALPITEALTGALVRDAAAREAPGATATAPPIPAAPAPAPAPAPAVPSSEPTLRPRDLQARMRAGATAQELADESGLPVENVRRYEWPVITEREHVIAMVRAHEVPGLDGTAELGTVADARLAARGVNPSDTTWTARREGTTPWVVEVRFWAGDRDRSARWTFDLRGRLVTPLDDEARWLGQPDDPLTPQVRGVPSITSRRAPSAAEPAARPRGSAPRTVEPWSDGDETDLLLDDLAGRRGHRTRGSRPATTPSPAGAARTPAPAAGEDDGFTAIPLGEVQVREASHGASVVDIGRWNPRRPRDNSVSPGGGRDGSQPALFTPTSADQHDGQAREPHASAPARRTEPDPAGERPGADRPPTRATPTARRKGRAQVPSWDEIVFGARPEPS